MIKQRELTRAERQQVKALVHQCANYDRPERACLMMDSGSYALDGCYMASKQYTGHVCRYFAKAVLPLNPELEAALTGKQPAMERRPCAVCGKPFTPRHNRQQYCGEKCQKKGNAAKSRERMKKKRQNNGVDVTI